LAVDRASGVSAPSIRRGVLTIRLELERSGFDGIAIGGQHRELQFGGVGEVGNMDPTVVRRRSADDDAARAERCLLIEP
jgi:hypothetical protein